MNALTARAHLYRLIREYFASEAVMEVDVPVIGRTAALDPHLDALAVHTEKGDYYLQTSPEYFHKRLLASGSGSIYSLTKAFRCGEVGRLHNPEFALLEWYRVDFQMADLIEDVIRLLQRAIPDLAGTQNTYAELFQTHLGINPHRITQAEIDQLVAQHTSYRGELPIQTGLELLFSQVIEPRMPSGVQVVTRYPAEQAALAKVSLNESGDPVALRFEVYINGIELANGYEELTDAAEQQRRFEREQQLRAASGQEVPEIDSRFLDALKSGLPACSGVALGVDRLLMIMLGAHQIADVMSFDWNQL